MIYYLAQKYTGIEEQAKNDAQNWVGSLVNLICSKMRWGIDGIFSPVMHTHQFDVEYGRSCINLDYVGWDLALCAGFLCNNGNRSVCPDCGGQLYHELRSDEHICLKCGLHSDQQETSWNQYDSGLTMLFAPTCFEQISHMTSCDWNMAKGGKPSCDGYSIKWASKGAKAEYDWAKDPTHNVRCLLLEPFLDGKEVEI